MASAVQRKQCGPEPQFSGTGRKVCGRAGDVSEALAMGKVMNELVIEEAAPAQEPVTLGL